MAFCSAVQQAFSDAKNSDGVPYPNHGGGTYMGTAIGILPGATIEANEARLESNRRTLANALYAYGDRVPAELVNDAEALKMYAISILGIANDILYTEDLSADLDRMKDPKRQRAEEISCLKAQLAAKHPANTGRLAGKSILKRDDFEAKTKRLEELLAQA